jgi:hypothetical protein
MPKKPQINKLSRSIFIFTTFMTLSAIVLLYSRGGLFAEKAKPAYDATNINSIAKYTIHALQTKDLAALKTVMGKAGVTFSPYYTANASQGKKLTPAQIPAFLDTKTPLEWGAYDGSGLPISLTGADYYTKFVYSTDFATAKMVSVNKSSVEGNNFPLSLIVTNAYPGKTSEFVEYYVPGTDVRYSGMDWQALALVFEKVGGKYMLIGVLHNQWTT